MLNTEQFNAVHFKSAFLIINGDYGTGKTFVLKERAKMFAENNKNEKIAYINLTGLLDHNKPFDIDRYKNPTVMDLMALNDLNHENIEVVSCHDLFQLNFIQEKLDQNLSTEDMLNYCLNKYLCKNGIKHIFIDEMVFFKS